MTLTDDFLYPPEDIQDLTAPGAAQKIQQVFDIIFAQLRKLRDATGSSAAATPHAILSLLHTDVAVATAQNGDILIRSGGQWIRLPKGVDLDFLQLVTGLPAWGHDGSSLTNLNASNLSSGTVPVARVLHDLLSAHHQDTDAAAVQRGDMVVGQVGGASADTGRYYYDGEPYDYLSVAADPGAEQFWLDGLPAAGLLTTGATKWRRKANGTLGYVWTAGAVEPDWQPAASAAGDFAFVYRAAVFSMANGDQTLVSFDTVASDAHGFWNAGAATRLTVPTGKSGRYVVVAQASWATLFIGNAWVAIYKNGARVAEVALTAGAAINTRAPLQAVWIADLVASDYIEVSLHLETTTGPYNVLGGQTNTFVQLVRV